MTRSGTLSASLREKTERRVVAFRCRRPDESPLVEKYQLWLSVDADPGLTPQYNGVPCQSVVAVPAGGEGTGADRALLGAYPGVGSEPAGRAGCRC